MTEVMAAAKPKVYTVEEVSKVLDRVRADYEVKGIRLAVITKDKYDDVLAMVDENWFSDEPFSFGFDLQPSTEWNQLLESYLGQNLSVMMIDEGTGDVIGVQIIGFSDRCNDGPEIQDAALKKFFELVHEIENKSGLRSLDDVDSFVFFFLLNIKRNYRQRKLGTTLVGACVALGRELGLKGAYTCVSSSYSKIIFKRFGFDVLLEIFYDSMPFERERLDQILREHSSAQEVVKHFT